MRILIDLTSLADNFSGIERFAACLANEMIKEMCIRDSSKPGGSKSVVDGN